MKNFKYIIILVIAVSGIYFYKKNLGEKISRLDSSSLSPNNAIQNQITQETQKNILKTTNESQGTTTDVAKNESKNTTATEAVNQKVDTSENVDLNAKKALLEKQTVFK